MKNIGKFIGGLFLFLLAWILFLPLSLLNFLVVALKFKDLGYFKSSAVSLDRFGNHEFRTLFNWAWRQKEGIKFANFEDTISSALGIYQRDGTLTKIGKALVWILDKIEKEHCKKSIKEIEN